MGALVSQGGVQPRAAQRGRFELGLGTGGFREAMVAIGGEARSPGENVQPLTEAIEIIRAMWSGTAAVQYAAIFEAGWAAGQTMTEEQASNFLLQDAWLRRWPRSHTAMHTIGKGVPS